MCGIVGCVERGVEADRAVLSAMESTLSHRGPDDSGAEVFQWGGVSIGLAHRRLSILDLSPMGHQPMSYNNLHIVFNGEIYNYQEIRLDLIARGHQLISTSDTEVILHAFDEWGMSCVEKFIGMFAFAIYDENVNKVFLCRDRLGVKPLFLYSSDNIFLFASELKAFHAHPRFHKKLSQTGLGLYLQYGYVPGPFSIFENVVKVEPATWTIIDLRTLKAEVKSYWSLASTFAKPLLRLDYHEAIMELETLVSASVRYRMVADVPVGIFLSGGFDSALVASIAQRHTNHSVKTFTIGFPDGVDEAPFAKQIAGFLGTEHHSYDCTMADAMAIIPDLPQYFDEPCADISSIPTILVSRIARKDVAVTLSGDGGDELFAGYDGFVRYERHINKLRQIPAPRLTAAAMRMVNIFTPRTQYSFAKRVQGLADVLQSNRSNQYQKYMETALAFPRNLVADLTRSVDRHQHPFFKKDFHSLNDERSLMLLYSIDTQLKDQLLVKVDRASMSASLEAREPLLDHHLLEFSARLPFDYKMSAGIGKRILKDLVYRYIPKSLMERPKTGFDLPLTRWLKTDLAYLIEDHLSFTAVNESGFFEPNRVKEMVDGFKRTNFRYQEMVWRILHFQMWYAKWMKNQ